MRLLGEASQREDDCNELQLVDVQDCRCLAPSFQVPEKERSDSVNAPQPWSEASVQIVKSGVGSLIGDSSRRNHGLAHSSKAVNRQDGMGTGSWSLSRDESIWGF